MMPAEDYQVPPGVPTMGPIGCLLCWPLALHWLPMGMLRVPMPTDGIICWRRCLNANRRPTVPEFQKYLPWFLHDRPTLQCAKG